MQNLTVQKVCIALVTLAVVVASPFLTAQFLEGNPTPVFIVLGVGILLLLVFKLGDRCWLLIPFCLPVEGTLNFLPINFSMAELATMGVAAYIGLQILMGRQIHWKLGPAFIWIPLAGLLGILLYHYISSGDIGIKIFGGTSWGGRRYYKIFLAVLTIPLITSFSGASWSDFQKVPVAYFLGSFVDVIPSTLSTLLPQTAPYIYRFYSSVNIGEYGKEIMGNFSGEAAITRYGAFAQLGTAVALLVLCYNPFRTWLNPKRLWILPSLLGCLALCALSGFRSYILRLGVAVLVAVFATARFRVLLVLPVGIVVLLGLAGLQGSVLHYPLPIQRALSFLPGQWDARASQETKGSSDWRKDIKELFYAEYFRKAPILGQGYSFDPTLAKMETDIYLRIAQRMGNDPYAQVRSFIEMRQPHEGDVHILLVTGVVGTFFFVAFCLSTCLSSLRGLLRTPVTEIAPTQVWCAALLFQQAISFFVVFGDLTLALMAICPVAAILNSSEKLRPDPPIPDAEQLPLPVPSSLAHA
jgi:hypothetical protein